MRNKYKGTCYQCGQEVEAGAGHFQRYKGSWRVHHAKCAITFRKIRETTRRESKQGPSSDLE